MISNYSSKFISELKKFKLDSLLLLIAETNREIYKNQFEQNMPPFLEINNAKHKPLVPFKLAKLSYLSILSGSNDHKHKIPTIENLYDLNNYLFDEDNRIYGEKSKNADNSKRQFENFYTVNNIIAEQGLFQLRRRDYKYNFLRYNLIIEHMSKSRSKQYDPNKEIESKTGFSIRDFCILTWCLFFVYAMDNSKITLNQNNVEFIKDFPIVTYVNIMKVVELFSGNYEFYRKNHNPLFDRPIIKTKNNEYIVSNTHLSSIKSYEAVYWLLKADNPSIFCNNFGYYYESYIKTLLEYYLDNKQFDKVSSNGNPQADWKIESTNFILIVEQKSALMKMSLKMGDSNYCILEEYILKNFIDKGFPQLKNTADKFKTSSNKEVIKLLLVFDNIFLKNDILKKDILKKLNFVGEKRYYFIDSLEFEQLIQLLSKDEKKFDTVINKMIEYEDSTERDYSKGTDFDHIFNELNYFTAIEFLENNNHFNKLL